MGEAKYARLFTQADSRRTGFLSGSQAVAYFSNSGLHRTKVNHVCTIADNDGDKKLSKQEFIIAMHLVMTHKQKRAPLPRTLPSVLENRLRSVTVPTKPNFIDFSSSPSPPSSGQDLF